MPASPSVDRDGNVYSTDIMTKRNRKLRAAGVQSVYREHSNAANGLLIDSQGRLIACEGATFERNGIKVAGIPRITRTDLKTGKMEILATKFQGKPLQGPNDVTMDGKGRLYFTDMAGVGVYRIDPSASWRAFSPPRISSVLTAFRFRPTIKLCT